MMLYVRLAGILMTLVGLFALGYHFGEMPYKTKYESLQAADWQSKANGEEAAKVVIAGQLVNLQKQIKVNSDARDTLQKQNDQITADHDATLIRVHRLEQLLAATAARAPAGGTVPKGDSGSYPADAGGAGGITEAEQLLIDAKEEAERNANRLDAVIAEVTPQVAPK